MRPNKTQTEDDHFVQLTLKTVGLLNVLATRLGLKYSGVIEQAAEYALAGLSAQPGGSGQPTTTAINDEPDDRRHFVRLTPRANELLMTLDRQLGFTHSTAFEQAAEYAIAEFSAGENSNDQDSMHTPGPWHVDSTSGATLVSCKSKSLAIIWGADKQRGANAQLMAAAPELLEALKAMAYLTKFSPDELISAARRRTLEVIAKAEGLKETASS